MKGLALVLRCQLCFTVHEIGAALRDKIELPAPWVARSVHVGDSVAKLYTEWQHGHYDADVLPRLFCCEEHRVVYKNAEAAAAETAHAEGLKVAQAFFAKAMRKEMLKTMDAVTALAMVAREPGLL